MRKLITVLFLSLMLSVSAEGAVKSLSLNDALSIALKKNFGYRIAEGRREIARAQKTGAAGGLLPFVSTSLSYGWTQRGPSSSFTQGLIFIPGSNRTSSSANYSLGLDIRQEVFDGGASFSNLKSSIADEAASRENFRSSRQGLIFNVKSNYFSVLLARKLLEVDGNALETSEEQLKVAQARYDLGSAALSDLLKAKVDLASAQSILISHRSDYQQLLANLNFLLGEDVNDSLELTDDLAQPEAPALGYEEALMRAEKNHPDLLAAQKRVEAADWGLQAGRAGLYPSIGLSAGYGWNNRDFSRVTSLFDRDYQWRFGFSISYNLFDRFSTYQTVKISRAQFSNAHQEYLQEKSRIALEVKRVFLNLTKSRQNIELNRQKVESAGEDLNIEQEKYKLGAATILDLQKSQDNHRQAQYQAVLALYDYNVAVAGLKKSIGEE